MSRKDRELELKDRELALKHTERALATVERLQSLGFTTDQITQVSGLLHPDISVLSHSLMRNSAFISAGAIDSSIF